MVSAVGSAAYGLGVPHASGPVPGGTSVAALQGQIRQAQVQLNDWTTCVSAKTPKGQAAIQKLSGQIGADREHIARALQAQAGASQTSATAASAPGTAVRAGTLDTWA